MEKKKLLIDSNIIIEHIRKKDKSNSQFYLLSKEYNFVISSIIEYEIRIGMNESNSQFIENLLEKLNVLDFDRNSAKKAAEIYLNLKANNQLIEENDLMIAATAIINNLPLSTTNKKHFKRIDELIVL